LGVFKWYKWGLISGAGYLFNAEQQSSEADFDYPFYIKNKKWRKEK